MPSPRPSASSSTQAFRRHAGIDLPATLGASLPDAPALAAAALACGVRVAEDDTWADTFSRVLLAKVEPQLGNGRATVLDQYPATLAALARPHGEDPRFAERFELYALWRGAGQCLW